MNRETIREKTMQLVYQMDISDEFDISRLNLIDDYAKIIGKKQSEETIRAVSEHRYEIDNVISRNLENWDFDRLAKTDLAILRTAVAEMLYLDDIPIAVSINEAVNLAKKYSDEKSYKFINSVLGKISNSTELKGE